MDLVECSFRSKARKLNKKRQAQLVKRVEKMLPDLQKAHESNNKEEVRGLLASLQMPSQKEWRKLIRGLVNDAVEMGVLRGHFELMRLRELYLFDEVNTKARYDYEVVLPKEARDYLSRYGLEISVITEETTLNKIRQELLDCLDEGETTQYITERVKAKAGTWMSDNHAQTIARTETGKMYNAGKLARYTDPHNNGFVEAMQYDAVVDTRTTDTCRHLDGRIVAITNSRAIAEYTPPNHFQCRATWLPITKFEEWEDNWDESMKPQEGFTFTNDVPKLLEGQTEPLVQPKKEKTVDPATIKDPDLIRNLDDDDFKIAIQNIEDPNQRLNMTMERAELMAVRNEGLQHTETLYFRSDGVYIKNPDKMTATIDIFNKDYTFYYDNSIAKNIDDFGVKLSMVKRRGEAEKLLTQFMRDNGSNPLYADFIVKVQHGIKTGGVSMKWNGLATVSQTPEAKKLLTIKTPPMSRNYKNATGLHQATKDGQQWLHNHVPSHLAPQTGVKLRYKHDNRRAYAQGGVGEIFFGPYEKNAGVIVHETAHVIHWQNKEVAGAVDTFFRQRTNNLGLEWNKRYGEDVIPDDFYNSYVGRIYGWEKRDHLSSRSTQGFYGQEVLSMGMQAMYENPTKFYTEDKEHFLFTYAILKGLY